MRRILGGYWAEYFQPTFSFFIRYVAVPIRQAKITSRPLLCIARRRQGRRHGVCPSIRLPAIDCQAIDACFQSVCLIAAIFSIVLISILVPLSRRVASASAQITSYATLRQSSEERRLAALWRAQDQQR